MSVPAFSQNKKRSEKIRRLEHVLRGNEITLPDFIRAEIVFESYSPGELIRTANDNVKTMSVMFSCWAILSICPGIIPTLPL